MSPPATADTGSARPRTIWERVIAATPVVMTVLATILAGLSSSEMSQAQYHRSLAAQTQSKAGDQWALFQAKRVRGASVEATLDLLSASRRPARFDPAELSRGVAAVAARLQAATGDERQAPHRELAQLQQELASVLADPPAGKALATMAAGEIPKFANSPIADPNLKSLVDAIAAQKPEEQTQDQVRVLNEAAVSRAIQAVEGEIAEFDNAVKPVNQAVAKVRRILGRLVELGSEAQRAAMPVDASQLFQINTDFTAARLRYEAARYQEESAANLRIGRLYEASVRHYGFISERHRLRSVRFFYGMVSAQAAVTMATIALAARERSLFWSLAAAVGLAAIAFGAYVYLFV